VLVVDDEEVVLRTVESVLAPQFLVFCARNTCEADECLRTHAIGVVVCDHGLPGEKGLDFLIRVQQTHPLVSRVLLTGCAEPEAMLAATNQSGVHRYLVKPVGLAELRQAVDHALLVHDEERRHHVLGKENADLRSALQTVLSRSGSLRESPARLLVVSCLGVLTVLTVALLLGLIVFVVLYALKSALGIDILPNWSHSGAV
jgi:two-component system response regulator HupR/HoxA